jgi:hypothetical protein
MPNTTLGSRRSAESDITRRSLCNLFESWAEGCRSSSTRSRSAGNSVVRHAEQPACEARLNERPGGVQGIRRVKKLVSPREADPVIMDAARLSEAEPSRPRREVTIELSEVLRQPRRPERSRKFVRHAEHCPEMVQSDH